MDKITEIEKQYDKIYRYCYFRLRSRELAEDITQETFLKFLESTGYRNRGKSLQYLYTIARNLCIDAYRDSRREVLLEEEGEAGGFHGWMDIGTRGGNVWSRAVQYSAQNDSEEKWVEVLAVREALGNLDLQEQEILLLRFANEMPIKDICTLLSLSRFAVHRRVKAALAHLREVLGEEDF